MGPALGAKCCTILGQRIDELLYVRWKSPWVTHDSSVRSLDSVILSSMNTDVIIADLRAEVRKLEQAIAVLESVDSQPRGRTNSRPTTSDSGTAGRRRLSAAGRRRIAAAQKARWAKIRAGRK